MRPSFRCDGTVACAATVSSNWGQEARFAYDSTVSLTEITDVWSVYSSIHVGWMLSSTQELSSTEGRG